MAAGPSGGSGHPGIRLAVTVAGRTVIEGDSDWLHFTAVFRGIAEGDWEVLLWQDGGIVVMVQPCTLEDLPEVPDDLSSLG